MKVNPAFLIWNYLIKFLEKNQGNLHFGSLLTTILEKKGATTEYLDSTDRLDEDIVFPTPIKLGDVSKMNIPHDASEVPDKEEKGH